MGFFSFNEQSVLPEKRSNSHPQWLETMDMHVLFAPITTHVVFMGCECVIHSAYAMLSCYNCEEAILARSGQISFKIVQSHYLHSF